ncbi:hypothetical protein D3C80_1663860 [compost metagenome]
MNDRQAENRFYSLLLNVFIPFKHSAACNIMQNNLFHCPCSVSDNSGWNNILRIVQPYRLNAQLLRRAICLNHPALFILEYERAVLRSRILQHDTQQNMQQSVHFHFT